MSSQESHQPDMLASMQAAAEQVPLGRLYHGVHKFDDSALKGEKTVILTNGAASAIGLEVMNYTGADNPYIIGSTGMTLAIAGCYAAVYASKRRTMLRQAVDTQESLQSCFDEPIDAGSYGVRWYGFDKNYHKADFDPGDTVLEFAAVVDVARQAQMPGVAVSAAIMDMLPGNGEFDEYKVAVPQASDRIIDKKSDEVVLNMPMEQAVALKDALLAVREGRNLSRSIAILREIDPGHPAVSIFERDGFSSLTHLEQTLRTRIEDKASHTTWVRSTDAFRSAVSRTRGHTQATVQGRKLMHFTESPSDKQPWLTSRKFDGATTIGSQKTYDELFADVAARMQRGSKPVEQVEQIAWRGLMDFKEKRFVPKGRGEALFQSVAERMRSETPRAFPLLRRYARGKDQASATLEFCSPERKKTALLAGGAALLLAGLFSVMPHLASGDGSSGSESSYGFGDSALLNQNGNSAFGDITEKGNQTAWRLTVPEGVSAEGYWPQQNVGSLHIGSASKGLSTPPYEDATLRSYAVDLHETGLRKVIPQSPGKDAIIVSGTVSYPSESVYGKGKAYEDLKLLPIPVLNGATVTSATAVYGKKQLPVYEDTPVIDIYQYDDGSYYLGLDTDRARGNFSEMDVRYTVEQNRDAGRRIVANHHTEYSESFRSQDAFIDEVISDSDAQEIARAMPGSPQVPVRDPEAVAEAVRTTHSYSLTPYKSSGAADEARLEYDQGERYDEDVLKNIGLTAASIEYAICNTAALQTLLVTRGQDEAGKPVQLTVGFHNDADNVISSKEGHMWLTDSGGKTIEPTPAGFEEVPLTGEQKKDLALRVASTTAAVVLGAGALSATAYVGRKKYKSRKLSHIAEALEPKTPDQRDRLDRAIATYQWLLYAPERAYTASQLASLSQTGKMRPIDEKVAALPILPGRKIKGLAAERRKYGNNIPADQLADITSLVRKVSYQRKHKDT